MEIAPHKVPRSTTREAMLPLLKATAWQMGQERGLATQVHEALAMAALATGSERCPVLDITEPTARWLRHYGRCQAFGDGMGGMRPPGETLHDSGLRDVHAFTVIHNESERLRKLDRKDDKGT